MNERQITSSLLSTAVADTTLDLFEGQYRVSNGMTYNSYLLTDEKTVLFDTADRRVAAEWLAGVEQAAGDRGIDYLVVSHMEPDHSAALRLLADRYPAMRIVGNAKTFQMIKSFYGRDFGDRAVVVGEGDTLETGAHTIRFFMAPMVHWPEVMVSYDEADGVLFSADAFGRFGLPGDPGDWADEARRYYINIVGKYGSSVQTLLKKLSGLPVKIICPLHGPVLTGDLSGYLEKYDIWSSYRPEERGVLIAYASIYGNTASAALRLRDMLARRGEKRVAAVDLARSDISRAVADAFRYDALVLAAPSYDGAVLPPMAAFLSRLKAKNWQKRTAAVIENGSWAPSAGKVMLAALAEMKDVAVLEPMVSIRSAVSEETATKLNELADALAARG
ncbi:MAG TPA: FprA family A-type flavoprotein [Firmicutes bacterium]|nr:FprA family A-type flavoprotein [Bacillota bacterium]